MASMIKYVLFAYSVRELLIYLYTWYMYIFDIFKTLHFMNFFTVMWGFNKSIVFLFCLRFKKKNNFSCFIDNLLISNIVCLGHYWLYKKANDLKTKK